MILDNGILEFTSYDLDHLLVYNEDLNIMKKDFVNKIKKSFNLKDIKEIIIPENIHFQELKTSYNSIQTFIKELHSLGNNPYIFPYFGLNRKSIKIDDINELIKEYISSNLKISLNISDSDYKNGKSIEVKILLKGEVISSEFDSFSLD